MQHATTPLILYDFAALGRAAWASHTKKKTCITLYAFVCYSSWVRLLRKCELVSKLLQNVTLFLFILFCIPNM
jgi:hypothetical protein